MVVNLEHKQWFTTFCRANPFPADINSPQLRVDYLNDMLKVYHARYELVVDTSVRGQLVFEDEKYYNLFLLKWS